MSNVEITADATGPEGATGVVLPRTAAEPTLDEHGRQRNRRLAVNVLTALLVKPLALLTPLVVAPLFVGYLGRDRYGLFESIVAMAQLIAISNGGITLGLVNRLMDCNVSGDRDLARRYVSSLSMILLGILPVVVIGWTAASFLVHWPHVFRTSNPVDARQMPWAVWITGISVAAGLIFALPAAIYQAYQENAVASLWDGAARVLTCLAALAVTYTAWGLTGVAIAVAAVPVAVAALNTAWVFQSRPWLRPSFRFFDGTFVRSVLGEGVLLFIIQASVLILYQSDKVIIGARVDPAAVTQYALLGKLFIVAYGAFYTMLGSLWAAQGEALRRNDWTWVRRALAGSLVVGICITGGTGAILLLFGDTIFRVWTRGQVTHVPANLICAMTSLFLLRAWVDCRSIILNSASVLLPQVCVFGSHAALNVVAAMWGAKHYGVAGVAWATPVTALVTSAWGYPWMLRRLIRRRTAPRGVSPSIGG